MKAQHNGNCLGQNVLATPSELAGSVSTIQSESCGENSNHRSRKDGPFFFISDTVTYDSGASVNTFAKQIDPIMLIQRRRR